MNTETQLREIESLLESMDNEEAIKRLKGVEGGGAADCCAGREAGKEQCDAEEAKPGSAALIAAEKAEDLIEWLMNHYDELAPVASRAIGNMYKDYLTAETILPVQREFLGYITRRETLEEWLSESRKAKAAHTLYYINHYSDPTL